MRNLAQDAEDKSHHFVLCSTSLYFTLFEKKEYVIQCNNLIQAYFKANLNAKLIKRLSKHLAINTAFHVNH